jgi:hypothetical protein
MSSATPHELHQMGYTLYSLAKYLFEMAILAISVDFSTLIGLLSILL